MKASERDTDERTPVTLDEAKAMLDVKDGVVHTFRQRGGIIIGADWNESTVLEQIAEHGCELSGDMATSMHHGLCLFDERGAVFLATKEAGSG